MTKWISIVLPLIAGFATPAWGGEAKVALALGERFAKAIAACDVPGTLALYEDDAMVVWPGQGEEGRGEFAIRKLVSEFCNSGKHTFKMRSITAEPIGADYIIDLGNWEDTVTMPSGKTITLKVRRTELLHKRGDKWLYLVDHASVGVPPQTPAQAGKQVTPQER